MANIEERTLTLIYGTTKNYFSSSGLYIDYKGWSTQPMAIWGSRSGTATMNSTGKAVLYPKAGVHPFKAEFNIWGKATVNDPTIVIKVDDVEVFNEVYPTNTNTEVQVLKENVTDEAILNSTIDSSITITLSASNTHLLGGFGMRDNSYLKLYFQQWDCKALAIGKGIAGLTCPGRLYAGESGTFNVQLRQGAIWQGWYSDAAHTQLVSANQEYTITATQDLTLYAYATYDEDTNNEAFYFKSHIINDSWIRPKSFYLKTINGWIQQNNTNILKENICNRFFPTDAIQCSLSDLKNYSQSQPLSFTYEAYLHPIVLITIPQNTYLRSWSTTASAGQIQINKKEYENLWIFQQNEATWRSGDIYFSDTFTITLNYFYYDGNNNYFEDEIIFYIKQNNYAAKTLMCAGFHNETILNLLRASTLISNNSTINPIFCEIKNFNTILIPQSLSKDFKLEDSFLANVSGFVDPSTPLSGSLSENDPNFGKTSLYEYEKNGTTIYYIFNDLTYRNKTEASIAYIEYRNGQPTGREFNFSDTPNLLGKDFSKGDSSVQYYLKLSNNYNEP